MCTTNRSTRVVCSLMCCLCWHVSLDMRRVQGVEIGEIRKIWKESRSHIRASRYKVHLASPARGRAPDPERVWIDLGPHPLSGLQELSHGGEILWDTVQTNFDGYEARVTFTATRISGEPIDCELITGNTSGKPSHIREVALDGYRFVIGGENDADGVGEMLESWSCPSVGVQ